VRQYRAKPDGRPARGGHNATELLDRPARKWLCSADLTRHLALGLGLPAVLLFALLGLVPFAASAAAAPVWNVESEALPTTFRTADTIHQIQIVIETGGSGSYVLSFREQSTAPMSDSATAPEIESALDALPTIGGSGLHVVVTNEEPDFTEPNRRFTVAFTGVSPDSDLPIIGAEGGATVSASSNDVYDLEIENLGSSSSTGTITVEDHLPAGVVTTETPHDVAASESEPWSCSPGAGQTVVTCTTAASVEPASFFFAKNPANYPDSRLSPIAIPVTVASAVSGTVSNTVTVSGGGSSAPAVIANLNPVNVAGESSFGPSYLNFRVIGSEGASFDQAGGHPYAVTTDMELRQEVVPGATDAADHSDLQFRSAIGGDEPRSVIAELPLGFIGDPQATPRCPVQEFDEGPEGGVPNNNENRCSADTGVGVVFTDKPGPRSEPYELFNLVPEPGHAAEFGLSFRSFSIVLYGDVVASSRGYVLRITGLIPQAEVTAISVTFFGDPASVFSTGGREVPFLTSPVDCGASETARTLMMHVDSWAYPGTGDPFDADFADPNWVPVDAILSPFEGCDTLTFNPSLAFQPTPAAEGGTTQSDEPSGYNVNLQVPQTESYSELATPELKTTTATFPEGVSVSPSAANGLQACSDAQIALESNEPGACPSASQIGTAKVTTPLLEEVLEGSVFLGEPECSPCSEADASDGRLFRLYLQVHSAKLGVTLKLPGVVRANPTTGRLTSEFADLPQLPYSDVELKLKDGPRAPLANPQTCGTFITSSDLEPWSAPETPTKVSESPFAITGCGAGMPFAPAFTAGTASQAAGAPSSFSVTFARNDGEQDLSGITLTTPPGLLGEIAGIPRCGEAEANAGTCSPASQIGTTTVSAGPGSDPYTITGGRVYLTGPYNGQPFGLSIVVPAVAGPFNLGNVIVRASITVNPNTAALTIAANPLPQIIDGVPVRLRTVDVEVNRPNFMLNATNCTPQSISATLTGEHPIGSGEAAKTSVVSTAYAASGCADLPFKPKLTASAGGKGSNAGGSSLDIMLASAGVGQAGIAKVDLQLPKALSTRDTTLNKACTEAQFAANPAGCPEGSIIGKAAIHTPILSAPLSGPAYLVSHGGAAFPDVEIVLQGEGVTLVLDGKTDIKKGITYSNFESTPDAPFTSFETELPTGTHSIFTANVPAKDNYSLCGTSLAMPTRLVGQNGAVIEQTTKIPVTGCKAAKPLTRAQKLTDALRTCKRDKKKRKRESCEAQARSKYGAKRTTKKASHGKGSK
jgi:hypothetical protein